MESQWGYSLSSMFWDFKQMAMSWLAPAYTLQDGNEMSCCTQNELSHSGHLLNYTQWKAELIKGNQGSTFSFFHCLISLISFWLFERECWFFFSAHFTTHITYEYQWMCVGRVGPGHCWGFSESLFPKPVAVAARGLRDLPQYNHINLHLKGSWPVPHLCVFRNHL